MQFPSLRWCARSFPPFFFSRGDAPFWAARAREETSSLSPLAPCSPLTYRGHGRSFFFPGRRASSSQIPTGGFLGGGQNCGGLRSRVAIQHHVFTVSTPEAAPFPGQAALSTCFSLAAGADSSPQIEFARPAPLLFAAVLLGYRRADEVLPFLRAPGKNNPLPLASPAPSRR